MGNTTNYVIIMLSINLVMGIVALGLYSVNPNSQYLASTYLFNVSENSLMKETKFNNSIRTYSFNYSSTGLGSLSSTAFQETTTFKVPDWIKSSNNWFNDGLTATTGAAKMIINFIGAPYIFLSAARIDSDLAALLGVFWTMLSTFIIANWLFGRDT